MPFTSALSDPCILQKVTRSSAGRSHESNRLSSDLTWSGAAAPRTLGPRTRDMGECGGPSLSPRQRPAAFVNVVRCKSEHDQILLTAHALFRRSSHLLRAGWQGAVTFLLALTAPVAALSPPAYQVIQGASCTVGSLINSFHTPRGST